MLTALPPNPIVPTVPFDEDGKHHGFLRLPYSRDDSAWSACGCCRAKRSDWR
jgi:N-alpha-acetyl-L-2,4-diaminobutyrate deacetylase